MQLNWSCFGFVVPSKFCKLFLRSFASDWQQQTTTRMKCVKYGVKITRKKCFVSKLLLLSNEKQRDRERETEKKVCETKHTRVCFISISLIWFAISATKFNIFRTFFILRKSNSLKGSFFRWRQSQLLQSKLFWTFVMMMILCLVLIEIQWIC